MRLGLEVVYEMNVREMFSVAFTASVLEFKFQPLVNLLGTIVQIKTSALCRFGNHRVLSN